MDAYINIQDSDHKEQIKPEKDTQKPKGSPKLLFSVDLLPETHAHICDTLSPTQASSAF